MEGSFNLPLGTVPRQTGCSSFHLFSGLRHYDNPLAPLIERRFEFSLLRKREWSVKSDPALYRKQTRGVA